MGALSITLTALATAVFAAVIASSSAADPKSAAALLAVHLDHKVIVDVPDYEGFDLNLPRPSGWRMVKATPETLAGLLLLLGVRSTPAVGFIDPHGNLIHVDDSEKSRTRKRFAAAIREYESKIGRLRRRLDSLHAEAVRSRQKRKQQREVDHLLQSRRLNVRGYPQVALAEQRIAAIERDRHARLYRILAHEGSGRTRKLIDELENLLAVSIGLESEAWIRRRLALLRRDVTVSRGDRS